MQGVWSLIYPTRANLQQQLKTLKPAGQEFYATVIKSGVNPKTIQVEVAYKYWNCKYKRYFSGTSKFQVHDEENFCVVGDKVIIRQCMKYTPTKYYYVRNVILPAGRDSFYNSEQDDVMKELQYIFILIREIRKSLLVAQ